MSGDRLIVVHESPRERRALARVLASTFRSVETQQDLPDPSSCERNKPRLLVMEHGRFLSDNGQKVARAVRDGGGYCLVLAGDQARDDIPTLFGCDALAHLLGNPMPLLAEDLLATAMKVLRHDYFGVEKYLSWGAEIRDRAITHTSQRVEAVEAITSDVQASGLGSRAGWLASMVTDELLSNALYDAPVDANGNAVRHTDDRDAPRELETNERVRLRYAFDARYLAVEVTDQFGSLRRETTLAHLAKCTAPNAPNKTSMLEGGAGLGTGLVYGCCSHLIYNVEAGKRTQAIALFDVRMRARDEDKPVSSFEFFDVRGH